MKDGMRFVDCDMHIMEPVDLFERYLDRRFRDRVTLPVGADGGLPLSLQLLGPQGADALVLAAAEVFECSAGGVPPTAPGCASSLWPSC